MEREEGNRNRPSGSKTFALLDDCDSTQERRSSRLYTGYSHELLCTDGAELDAVVATLEDELRRGLYAVVIADYEFGAQLQFRRSDDGVLRFLVFKHCSMLSRTEVGDWLRAADEGNAMPSPAGVSGSTPSADTTEFAAAIDSIHESIRAGDAYQINYTYRLEFDVVGKPVALYRRLRERQAVRYGALIALADGAWILSCSPELFISKSGRRLLSRPMKGTAPRSSDPVEDQKAATFLSTDPKNRAENVMIVDLLRNDLSRVAEIGTVRTPSLFSVEKYTSVWQMTSTVEAAIRSDVAFADVLRALFPCGSITGAPKHMSMQLIDALETTPRGIYTGAIGWLEAPSETPNIAMSEACGDFCLSVAIRTLTLSNVTATGNRRVLWAWAGESYSIAALTRSMQRPR